MKLLFVYEHYYNEWWKDGLWAALELLKDIYNHDVVKWNIAGGSFKEDFQPDFTLGWGAFGSNVDRLMLRQEGKKGLCIGGNAMPPHPDIHKYDVLFHETDWYKSQLDHNQTVHAFGTNTDIYRDMGMEHIWDYISVGAYALWKRQELLLNKPGYKLAIGEVQKNNMEESMAIINQLLIGGVAVSGMIDPYSLAKLYNLSLVAYIPANIVGGGERAVLEARACGLEVEVENDNPKLKELLYSEIYDQHYYAKKLDEGISMCL